MGKSNLALVLIILATNTLVLAQDKHNFLVPPQNSSCDSILIDHPDIEIAINNINNATFRFQQNISVNREKGFKEASYFSCDNLNGYMVIKFHDSTFLYSSIPKVVWEGMIKSRNPGDFFENNIKNTYAFWLSKGI